MKKLLKIKIKYICLYTKNKKKKSYIKNIKQKQRKNRRKKKYKRNY